MLSCFSDSTFILSTIEFSPCESFSFCLYFFQQHIMRHNELIQFSHLQCLRTYFKWLHPSLILRRLSWIMWISCWVLAISFLSEVLLGSRLYSWDQSSRSSHFFFRVISKQMRNWGSLACQFLLSMSSDCQWHKWLGGRYWGSHCPGTTFL